MPQLSPEELQSIEALAARYGLSADAALTVLSALQAGGGQQAQFSHPELGGVGQWTRGGMIMIGDMFNSALRARVAGLCSDLSAWLDQAGSVSPPSGHAPDQTQYQTGVSSDAATSTSSWWPVEFDAPASAGAQNDFRYAYFPATHRLAIAHNDRMTIYDTGDHQISGVSQQQALDQSVTFTSQHGTVRTADLRLITSEPRNSDPRQSDSELMAAPHTRQAITQAGSAPPNAQGEAGIAGDDIFAKIERLAELRRKNILTEEEYAAKKAELLARL